MKKTLYYALFISLLAVVFSSDAFAFRCGNRLASIGDTKSEILNKCGSPSWMDSWEEQRIEYVLAPLYSTGVNPRITRIPLATVVSVTIEEWTYNNGPSQFIRTLRFENSRLVDINVGDYGY